MTYSAPRQGLFAIIILVSASLHLLFFVIGQEYKLTQQYQAVAQQEVVLLAEEMTAPLNAVDRVSMSVIAGRYIQDEIIDFIGVYDSADNLLVPVGKESKDGFIDKEVVTSGSSVLGSVVIHTKAISRAKIISDNWLFLLGIFALYSMIWLIYGYLARPSKELRDEIANDVRIRLLATGILSPHLQMDASSHISEGKEDTQSVVTEQEPQAQAVVVTEALESDQPEEVNNLNDLSQQLPEDEQNSLLVVQIRFEDPHQLLDTVSHQTKSIYFSLYDQLLNKSVQELLKLPILAGVSLFNIDAYDNKGALVILKAQNRHAKVGTAAIMLAKLVLMLNQIVYEKHRELKRFCLPVRTMVSDVGQAEAVVMVAKKHNENPLILVPASVISQVENYIELGKLLEPLTVSERESRFLKKVSQSTAERLQKVRDAVLLSD